MSQGVAPSVENLDTPTSVQDPVKYVDKGKKNGQGGRRGHRVVLLPFESWTPLLVSKGSVNNTHPEGFLGERLFVVRHYSSFPEDRLRSLLTQMDTTEDDDRSPLFYGSVEETTLTLHFPG